MLARLISPPNWTSSFNTPINKCGLIFHEMMAGTSGSPATCDGCSRRGRLRLEHRGSKTGNDAVCHCKGRAVTSVFIPARSKDHSGDSGLYLDHIRQRDVLWILCMELDLCPLSFAVGSSPACGGASATENDMPIQRRLTLTPRDAG